MAKQDDDRAGLAAIDRALGSFDGTHVASLGEAAAKISPSKAVLGHLIKRCTSMNDSEAVAASWLLKHYLENGAELHGDQASEIVDAVNRIRALTAQLHLAQIVARITVPDDRSTELAESLGVWFRSDHKFLRAWACDALWHLGKQHAHLRQLAIDTLLAAERDPAASVRARARNLLKLN